MIRDLAEVERVMGIEPAAARQLPLVLGNLGDAMAGAWRPIHATIFDEATSAMLAVSFGDAGVARKAAADSPIVRASAAFQRMPWRGGLDICSFDSLLGLAHEQLRFARDILSGSVPLGTVTAPAIEREPVTGTANPS